MWLLCLLFFFDIASLVLCTDAQDVIFLLSFFISLTFVCFPYLCFPPFSSILLDFSLLFVSCRYVFSFLRLFLFILLFVLFFHPLLCSGLLFCNAFLPLLCIACQLFCFAFVLISTLLVLFYSLCLICHGLFFSSYWLVFALVSLFFSPFLSLNPLLCLGIALDVFAFSLYSICCFALLFLYLVFVCWLYCFLLFYFSM